MFQPQATPFPTFASYGVGNSIVNFPGFQPATEGPVQVVDSGGPTTFRDTIFSPVNANASANGDALSYNSAKLNQRFKMDTNDFEAQEALAREFRPALEGPLVGEKKSSRAITEEYAKADPIYVAKTAALPQKYSHYRPILGDGNCGWRAAGFSYFETLVRLGNKSQLEGEIARMISLNNLLTTVGGHESWLFEDMVEQTTDLLREVAATIHSPETAMNIILQRFNDPAVSDPIIYHFRLLASSCLKGNPEQYQGFIPSDEGVGGYCKNWLEAVNQEIDHLGMSLLIDILLKPIGFAVEIVYLDRSEGSQVNSHMFQAEDENGVPTNPGGPIIHLLYRPSHYDILYREVSVPHQVMANPNIQVNRATNFSQQHNVQNTTPSMNSFSNLDMSTLLTIPGFSCPIPPSHHGFPAQYSPIEPNYTPSPISASISPISPGPSPIANSSTSNLSLSTTFPQQASSMTSPTIATPHSAHAAFPTTTQLPIHTHSLPQSHPIRPSLSTHPSMSSHASDLASPVSAASSFRPSKYEWEAAADWQEGPVVFQTSTFKNSHYNTAHYNNPHFQPEEWTPDSEEPEKGAVRKRSS